MIHVHMPPEALLRSAFLHGFLYGALCVVVIIVVALVLRGKQ